MDNASFTDVEDDIIGIAIIDGVLLLIVIAVTVLSLIVIAALIDKDNSELARSIRVILINILVASIVGGLASVMYHISSLIFETSTSDSVHGSPLCQAIVFLNGTGSSGRVLFTAYYGVTVFIVVHYWHQPVLAPRNTKYFIIASAVVWLLALIAGIPSFFDGAVSRVCSDNNNNTTSFTLYVTVPYFVVSSIPIIVTPIILIKTACYVKRNTIGEHRDSKKALVKFGVFLMIIQGVNAFSQIVAPLLIVGTSSRNNASLGFIIGVTLADLSRIPTNILLIIFFQPVQVKVKRWICFCCCERKRATRNGTSTNNNATPQA